MDGAKMLIGKLADKSGFSRDTIRYYEKLGILNSNNAPRRENGYKDYPPQVLERLAQISQLKQLGFTLDEIRSLFDSLKEELQPCANLPQKLDSKIAQLEEKMRLIEFYREKLIEVRQACNGDCVSDAGLPECIKSTGC